MTTAMTSVDVLNRLLVLHKRSLPIYLSYATPWVGRNDAPAMDVLNDMVESHKEFVDRFAELILAEHGAVAQGEFPMRFTAYHDCGLNFLIPQVIAGQEAEIREIESCIAQLHDNPMAKAVAQEALGAAKAHLDALRELPY